MANRPIVGLNTAGNGSLNAIPPADTGTIEKLKVGAADTVNGVVFADANGEQKTVAGFEFNGTDTMTVPKLAAALNGTVGATTPAAGAFTTLSASGATTLAGALGVGDSANFGANSAGACSIRIGPETPSSNDAGSLEFRNSNAVKNWKIGHNLTVGGSTFEIIPSATSGGSTFTTPALTIKEGGIVGIGGAASAWVAGYRVVQNNSASWYADNSGNSFFGANTYQSSGFVDRYVQTGFASYYSQGSGAHTWYTAPSGTAGNAITFTQAMTLDASGNLAATTIRPGGYTVATLPAGTIGMRAYVTDALAPAFLTTLVGGGAAYSGAQFNGTNWVGD
jgi:hypothetical protein